MNGLLEAEIERLRGEEVASAAPLPITELLTDNTLILPVFHQMTSAEQDRVIDAVTEAARLKATT